MALAVSSTELAAQDNPVHAIVFGSMEAGPSTFVTTGAKLAFDDVNREGFVALVTAGGGLRREKGPAEPGRPVPTLVRASLLGAVLGGYQFVADWGVVAFYAGPEGSLETLMGADALRSLPPRFGLRLQGEVWARPTENTLATVTLIGGSARWDVYGRVSAGYRLWGAYLGPEAAYYGDRTGYRKISLGLHATDFAFGSYSLRVSGGCLYEVETDRVGPYLSLAIWSPL